MKIKQFRDELKRKLPANIWMFQKNKLWVYYDKKIKNQ